MTGSILPALLLLGPTGSGKSPAGRALARSTGWLHLDFGARLRQIASGEDDHGLDRGEQAFVRSLVAANALFPDDALPLVRRIVGRALGAADRGGRVILNGVPRTVAQAAGLADLVAVAHVVVLVCPPETVARRVERRRAGAGSDDAGRADDTPGQVARKLELFERETRPLVAYYGGRGASVLEVPVAAATGEDEIVEALRRAPGLGVPGPGGR